MLTDKLSTIARFATGLATTAVSLVSLAGENDLYSEVQTGTVFSSPDSSKGTDATETPRITRRITSLEQLSQLVRDSGFETKTADGRSVTTTKTLEPWLFPVSITLSDDERHLQLCVVLGAVSDKQKIDAGKLLALLEANKQQTSAKFGFNAARSRTELLEQIRNDGVTAEMLRDEINRLALAAKESEAVWQIEPAQTFARTDSSTSAPDAAVRLEANSQGVTPANSPTSAVAGDAKTNGPPGTTAPTQTPTPPLTQTQTPTPTQTPTAANPATPSVATPGSPSTANTAAVQASTLTGRWSASRASNEAFAILFDANGSFVLVSIKEGQQARSTGKYTIVGTQLTLDGTDGTRLSGTVAMKSATEFSFHPASSTTTIAAFNFRKSP